MINSGIDPFKEAVWAGRPASAAELRPPTTAQAEETFLKGMLETPWKQERQSPAKLALSIFVHVIIVGGVVLAPLFFTQVMDLRGFQSTFLVAPRPPAAPPPAMAPQKVARPLAHLLQPKMLMAPALIPAKVQVVRDEVMPPDLREGVVGGVSGGESGGVLGGIIGGIAGGEKPPPPPSKAGRVMRVGGVVKAPRELYRTEPTYPVIARAAHVEGAVVIDALIDEHGNVVQAQAIEGPPQLLSSALAAVLKWKYEPTYLDGEPVSIKMHLVVRFSLR